MHPDISVVISTYNRSKMLAGTIESLLRQEGSATFEVLVVDNNSTDDTAAVVRSYEKQSPLLRYVFEPKQGVSYGRNAGIAAARSDLLLFTDDDVTPDPRWVEQAKALFENKPEYGCIGGKVLPLWPAIPPSWLTRDHWSPLALLDYETGMVLNRANRKCLITANMGIRRTVFAQIGYFVPRFQKTKGSTCSMEDRELQERYWTAGGQCWYDPGLVVYADIQPERLGKDYHRKWHYAHGRLYALLKDPETERSGFRVLGLPGHVIRQLIEESAAQALAALGGHSDVAFGHEVKSRFSAGFIRQRLFG
ncbi:MAG TPA: glycosyltransferase [Bryobacteraceae bacterium]|jgi:glycosyltransferase involved in cell wall biosynthesis|nr:glycosyltransferase [Bryobacteraceae bacterium]